MKKSIKTNKAPGAIGPYSQAVSANGLVFVSGQLPIKPESGAFAGDDIKSQTAQSLENIKSILEEAGSSMENVLKVTVFLNDMNEFAGMNEVYATYFSEPYPARAAVEAARLPKDALIEIEAIAAV